MAERLARMVGTVASGQREMVRVAEGDRVSDCVVDGQEEREMDRELEAQRVLVTEDVGEWEGVMVGELVAQSVLDTEGEDEKEGEFEVDLVWVPEAHLVLVTVGVVERVELDESESGAEGVGADVAGAAACQCQRSSRKNRPHPPRIVQLGLM